MATSSGAGDLANQLLPSLLDGKEFEFPEIDLNDPDYEIPEIGDDDPINKPVTGLTNDDLTTKVVGGTGTFDILMASVKSHIKEEYSASRIVGDQYAKAYIELTAATMGNAVQFLLQKDQAYWQAIMVQQQAKRAMIETVTAKVQLATSRAQLAMAKYQALTAEVEYALTKLKLATEDAQFAGIKAQTAQTEYQTTQIFPIQKLLVQEQMETARAQTLDKRSDGATVVGAVGKQKDLYTQQIDSYKRDSELKAAKTWTDAWITMKTIDEGLTPPTNFTNANLDIVLNRIKINNGLNQ